MIGTRNILFVDDEKQILKSLNRLFMALDYNIFLAEGGEEALDILSKNHIDLVVADMRMPHMTGYDLLKQVKQLHPDTIRIILSGYADESLAIRSLNENLASTYIFKPWDNDVLISQIYNIFDFETHLKEKNLMSLINQLENLKTLPHLYAKITECMDNDADIEAVTEVIQEDLTMAAKVLQIVNSAFYGVKTASLKSAISYMGLGTLKSIVLASSVLPDSAMDKRNYELIWAHANLTNKLLTPLYEALLSKKLPDNYTTAGLLHDIGRVILMNNLNEKYNEVEQLVHENEVLSYPEAEKRILKTTHQEIGGYFLNWWGLPLPIVEAALFHHDPMSDSVINKEIVAIVHIASYYAWSTLKQHKNMKFNSGVYNILKVTKEECEDIIENIMSPEQ